MTAGDVVAEQPSYKVAFATYTLCSVAIQWSVSRG
jgi:hypothetical protein